MAHEINSFTPELSISLSRGGLVRINVKNIDNYWKDNAYDTYLAPRLLLSYGANYKNKQIFEMKTLEIQAGRIPSNYPMHFKIPLFLCAYKLKLSISAFNIHSKQWMQGSSPQIIQIPSIWSWNEYQIGDEVVFKPENEVITQNAAILDVLDDINYKLL